MEVLFVGLILVHVAVTLCQGDAVRTMLQGEGGSDGSEARESKANGDGLDMAQLMSKMAQLENQLSATKSEVALLKKGSSSVESRIEKRKRLIPDESKLQNGSTFRAADRFTDIEKKFKSVDKVLKEHQKIQEELQSQVNQIQSAATRCETGNERLEHGKGYGEKSCSFSASFKTKPKVVTAIHYWAGCLYKYMVVQTREVTKSGFTLSWDFGGIVQGTIYIGDYLEFGGFHISWIACASLG